MQKLLVALAVLPFLSFPEPLVAESAPAIKVAVAPEYPVLTLAGRIYGDVTVSVVITRAGVVGESAVLTGHPMLREAAINAARQWQFTKSSISRRKIILTFRFVILPEECEVKSETLFLPPAGFEIRKRPEPVSLMEEQQGEPGNRPEPISVTRLLRTLNPVRCS